MPLGILSEIYFGIPPIFALISAIAMTVSVVWLGISFWRIRQIDIY